jgi:hypothetical protein
MRSFQIHLDPTDHILGRDHVETLGDPQLRRDLHRLLADVPSILFVAVADELTPRLPAAALQAARQRSDRADVLMLRIRFPLRRFTTAT